jgi:hypothetical protein
MGGSETRDLCMSAHKPAIVIAAYNRPNCLARILSSLIKADYTESAHVSLIISLDKADSREVADLAQAFNWPFGEKRVIERKERLGWPEHAIACGALAEEYGSLILLEDDLYVSTQFYVYATQALDFYAEDKTVAGISLYALHVNENAPISLPFYPLEDDSDVFFLQKSFIGNCAMTYGQWRQFIQWRRSQAQGISAEDDLPSRVLSWPETSLSKHFIKYLVDLRSYIVFPRTSLSTNFGDTGLHVQSNRVFQVPLELSMKRWRFRSVRDSLSVYDAFHELIPDRLNTFCSHFSAYDYVVDLYGTRDLNKVRAAYLLTIRRPERFLHSFGSALIPMELNVIETVPGEGIWFCEKEALKETRREHVEVLRRSVAYFFPEVPMGSDAINEFTVLRSECLEKETQIGLLSERCDSLEEQLRLAQGQLRSVGGMLKALVKAVIRAIMRGLGLGRSPDM